MSFMIQLCQDIQVYEHDLIYLHILFPYPGVSPLLLYIDLANSFNPFFLIEAFLSPMTIQEDARAFRTIFSQLFIGIYAIGFHYECQTCLHVWIPC